MRSFTISAFAALAFGLLCSAAPLPGKATTADLRRDSGLIDVDVDVALKRSSLIDADIDLDVLGLVTADVDLDVLKRDTKDPQPKKSDPKETDTKDSDSSDCLEDLLTEVVSVLTPIVTEIKALEGEITKDVLKPIFEKVSKILSDLIKAVEGLSLDKVLKGSDGKLLDVGSLAKLIADVIRAVICILQAVLDLVSDVVKADCDDLLKEVGDLLGKLLSIIISLVGSLLSGLIPAVVSLIKDLVSCILDLDLKICIQVLGLKVSASA